MIAETISRGSTDPAFIETRREIKALFESLKKKEVLEILESMRR